MPMIACQYTMGKKPMGGFCEYRFCQDFEEQTKKRLVGSFGIDGLIA